MQDLFEEEGICPHAPNIDAHVPLLRRQKSLGPPEFSNLGLQGSSNVEPAASLQNTVPQLFMQFATLYKASILALIQRVFMFAWTFLRLRFET